MHKAKFLSLLVSALAVIVVLAGCELSKNHLKIDRARDMEFQDFRDALAARSPDLPEVKEAAESGAPPLMSYVAPVSENMRSMPLVSISVNQTVPLRDVLFELASQADYDIELDPRIKGSIIFTARNRPFDLVIQRIADIAGLRYEFDDDMLRVELDTPYHHTYKIDYVNLIRSSQGQIKNEVSVVSGEGADTGSTFTAANSSEANFWGELEASLAHVLGVDMSVLALRTSRDPRITAVDEAAPVVPTAPVGDMGAGGEQDAATVLPPAAVLRVDSLPIEGDDPSVAGAQAQGQNAADAARFSINKHAGLINVYANQKQHKKVAEYLGDLRRTVSAQVLIEAKVLEVSLTDEFATGIEWNSRFLSNELVLAHDVAQSATNLRPSLDPEIDPLANFVLGYFGNDFQAAIQAISRFGTVRALASPRLTVMNNQPAVLNVANNQVYFQIDIDVTTEEGVTSTEVDSEIKNVPEGVLINVLPSINLDKGVISMALRPTITRIVDYVNDPAVAFVVANSNLQTPIASQIPVVNVQEMDSVIQVNSGQAIVMGGLMQDRYQSQQNAVPVLGEMPILGSLFRSQNDRINKTELVIFLKATIVDNGNVHNTDKDLYRTFSQDRRPLRF